MLTQPLSLPSESSCKGHVIIRAESARKSDIYAKFQCRWLNLNNLTGGFIGVGQKRQKVLFSIGKQIQDTEDRFKTIVKTDYINQPDNSDYTIRFAKLSLKQLCDGDQQ